MKGRKCYAGGGATKTKSIGGITAPMFGQSKKVMGLAKKGDCEGRDYMKAEGNAAKSNLGKSGKKASR